MLYLTMHSKHFTYFYVALDMFSIKYINETMSIVFIYINLIRLAAF